MNENENTGDSVSVAEAAARLGVTIPRLRRLLQRPEFASIVRQEERQTRTGTRTGTVLPVSVLVSLQNAFEKQSAPDHADKPEREREREQVHNQNENENAEEHFVRNAPADDSALVAALQSEVTFLRAEVERRDVAESELRRLMLADRSELQSLRQQLAIRAAQEVVTVPESGDVINQPVDPKATPGTAPVRQWWQFWKKDEGYKPN